MSDQEKQSVPFYPDHVSSEAKVVVGIVVIALVFGVLGMILPIGLGDPADALNTPEHVKPEWYFLALYQILKYVSKTAGVVLPLLIVALLTLWPFLDRRADTSRPSLVRRLIVVAAILVVIVVKLAKYGALTAGLAAIAGPVIAYFYPAKLEETPSEPVLVGPLSELPTGSSKTVRFGRYPALVIHTKAGLRAYSAVCTHFACIVKWDAGRGEIICPCHDGFFAAEDGAVLAGPPPTNLKSLPVSIVEDQIYVGEAA